MAVIRRPIAASGETIMVTLTPTRPMRPASFERHALFRSFPRLKFCELRLTPGTVLRIAVDIGSIWISFLFVWLIVDGNDLAALIAGDSAGIVPPIGFLSILAVAAYIAVGLYAYKKSYTLLVKICAITAVNILLLAMAGAILSIAAAPVGLSFGLLATTLVGSVFPLSLARVGSAVLRMENSHGDGKGQHEEADEKKVLVIGGAGYIGSALVEKLLKLGLQVSVLDAMHYGEETLSRVAEHPNLTLIRED